MPSQKPFKLFVELAYFSLQANIPYDPMATQQRTDFFFQD